MTRLGKVNAPTIADRADTATTAAAIAQRVKLRAEFTPAAGGAFTHGTTLESTLIPAPLSLGLTTAASSAALIAACTAIQDYVNSLDTLVNRMVYTMELNGLTS